jgi:orotate phosphoribosyltransferase
MTISAVRWKLRTEGKEFFNKPGSIKTSIRGFKSGLIDNYYIDFDNITSDALQARNVVSQLVYKINDIKTKQRIDYLGFIEKRFGGTTGAIKASLAISIMTGIPNIILRPRKELEFERVKIPTKPKEPRRLQLNGSNVALITDHITTGREIIKSAEIILRNGGKVNDVVTFTIRYDKLDIKKIEDLKIQLHYIYKIPEDIPFEYIAKIESKQK